MAESGNVSLYTTESVMLSHPWSNRVRCSAAQGSERGGGGVSPRLAPYVCAHLFDPAAACARCRLCPQHAAANGNEYGDYSCTMGLVAGVRCFNAPNAWAASWAQPVTGGVWAAVWPLHQLGQVEAGLGPCVQPQHPPAHSNFAPHWFSGFWCTAFSSASHVSTARCASECALVHLL